MIRKLAHTPAALSHIGRAINTIVDIHNKGYIKSSDTVLATRTPDGRIRLKLNPEVGPGLFACCLPDNTCADMTSADCAAAGGTWHAGILCVNFDCGALPTPTLLCDEISASRTKCGFKLTELPWPDIHGYPDFSRPVIFNPSPVVESPEPLFSTLTITQNGSETNGDDTYRGSYDFTTVMEQSGDKSITSLNCVDRECVAAYGTTDGPGSCSATWSCAGWTPPLSNGFCDPFGNYCALPSFAGYPGVDSSYPIVQTSRSSAYGRRGFGEISCPHGQQEISYLLSDEFTTAALVSKTEDDLPDYPNTWTGECSASYDLSDDETSLAIQEFQYQFTVATPPSAGAVLLWNERFTPDVGAPVDNPMNFAWDGSVTQTGIYQVDHPASNGEITIQDIRWQ
jgi:hypothetical protein